MRKTVLDLGVHFTPLKYSNHHLSLKASEDNLIETILSKGEWLFTKGFKGELYKSEEEGN